MVRIPTKKTLLLLLLPLFTAGCFTTSIRYAVRTPKLLISNVTIPEQSKPIPILDDDSLDAADIEEYFRTHTEKLFETEDLPSVSMGDNHPLTIAIAQWMGTKYRFGGNGRKGIDCSGFVNEVFEEVGIDLPRSSREIARIGAEINREKLRYGDILTFARKKSRIHHVGIYLGDGRFAHASRKGVTVSTIEKGYWAKRYLGARRLDIKGIENAKPPVPVDVEEGGDPTEQTDAGSSTPVLGNMSTSLHK
ncbi:MAG: NlpC/P60 family protein [bacterium]|nr:NlpC/P60 family protein [bacterium]